MKKDLTIEEVKRIITATKKREEIEMQIMSTTIEIVQSITTQTATVLNNGGSKFDLDDYLDRLAEFKINSFC